jgi:hypothetical protein
MKLLPLLLVPLVALALPALAQTAPDRAADQPYSDQAYDAGPAPDAQGARPPRRAGANKPRFRDADSNGDGRLSRAEAQVMPFVARHFDVLDANRDGYVTRDELRAARERKQATREQRVGRQPGNYPAPPSDGENDGMN